MPTVDELIKKNKKFKKSTYRPWNYMDEIEKELAKNKSVSTKEPDSPNKKEKNKFKKYKNKHLEKSKKKYIQRPIKQNKEKQILKNEGKEDQLQKLLKLTNYQSIIFNFLADKCLSRGLLSTGIVKMKTLLSLTKATKNMVKISINRLIDKGLVIRELGKCGRGGFYQFSITDDCKTAILDYKRIIAFEENDQNVSSKIDKNLISLPKDWLLIDIGPLSDIGFSHNHLLQLYQKGKFTPEDIQHAINHFSFRLNHRTDAKKFDTAPLNVLMGRFMKGIIWNESEYESPKDRNLHVRLESARKAKAKRDQIIQELVKLEFPDWEKKLTEEERQRIAPPEKARNTDWNSSPEKLLRDYFAEEVLPKRLEEEGA